VDRAVDGFGMTSVEGARDLRGRASSRDGGDAYRDAEGTGGDCKAGGGEQRAPAGADSFANFCDLCLKCLCDVLRCFIV
jgi:hypothetical protein